MTVSRDLIDLLLDGLTGFGPVAARRMFSGAGLFRDGLMFAIVIDDVLYFKTDAETAAAFEDENLGPFTYATKHGDKVLTNYRRAPARCLDDGDELKAWAARAFAVAIRANARKARKTPPRPRRTTP